MGAASYPTHRNGVTARNPVSRAANPSRTLRGQRSPHPARVILAVDLVRPAAASADADLRAWTPGPNSGEPHV
jgi:hypothetical protein